MGIRENELRVGNWVLSPTQGEIQIENGWQIDEGEEVKPIPLTEEWLLKFGFDSDPYQDMYVLGWLKINCDKTRGGLELWVENITGNVVYLQHVHSLQNLYFALTGEELTIKTINQNKEDESKRT